MEKRKRMRQKGNNKENGASGHQSNKESTFKTNCAAHTTSAFLKGHLLCPFLRDVIQISDVPKMCLVKLQLKIPHRYILKMPILSASRNSLFLAHVSLNANELQHLAPFYRIGLYLYNLYSAKKHLYGFDYYVYHAEIMNQENHSLLLI